MATVKVIFHELLQDSQDLGSDDEHMVSRLFFAVEVNGQPFNDLYADLKQTVGSSYGAESLEVSPPRGAYKGPFDYDKFQKAAEDCYRSFVGSGGFFNLGGASDVRMRNNRKKFHSEIEFEASGPDVSW
jgi:hypothetical protein